MLLKSLTTIEHTIAKRISFEIYALSKGSEEHLKLKSSCLSYILDETYALIMDKSR